MDIRAIHDVMVVGLIAHLALCGLLAVVGLPKNRNLKNCPTDLRKPQSNSNWQLVSHCSFHFYLLDVMFFFPIVCFEFVNKLLKP